MSKNSLSGALTCARYALAPNYYHYCGPDTHGAIVQQVSDLHPDQGLIEALEKFETLYPYLSIIAEANGINDPLNPMVVEAYWIGNTLLDRVPETITHRAFTEHLSLQKRLQTKEFTWLLSKIQKKARLHHSFHVFNVFMRTGHHSVPHTVESMDKCRIGWGRIATRYTQPFDYAQGEHATRLLIHSQRLIYQNGKLQLILADREVTNMNEELGKRLQPGDWVSYHWDIVCDKLSLTQVKRLSHLTLFHIQLANETL